MASESDAGGVEKTDVNLMNSSGEIYLADINLVRLEEEGRPAGYLLVIEDITEKKPSPTKLSNPRSLRRLVLWLEAFRIISIIF